MAESHNHVTSFIKAPEKQSLAELMYPTMHQVLRKLSMVDNAKAKAKAYAATGALPSFAGSFQISVGDFYLSVIFFGAG